MQSGTKVSGWLRHCTEVVDYSYIQPYFEFRFRLYQAALYGLGLIGNPAETENVDITAFGSKTYTTVFG